MRVLLTIIELFLTLPWWGASLLAVALIALIAAPAAWLYWKIRSLTNQALTQASSPLLDAAVRIHSVEATVRPTTNSPYDEDDEECDETLDYQEAWQTEGDFYWIDATITPRDPSAMWHASVLTLVPANWQGAVDDICETPGPLHTVELIDQDGRRTLRGGEDMLTGPRHVRLLMAAPEGHAQVKLAYFGATFGDFRLPAPLELTAR